MTKTNYCRNCNKPLTFDVEWDVWEHGHNGSYHCEVASADNGWTNTGDAEPKEGM